MNARRCLAASLLVCALLPRAAAAQVSDQDRATARALTLDGFDALDKKDYATAADRFGRADSLYHVPTVALGLAQAQVGLGKLVAALGTYSRIVRDGAPAGSPPAFGRAVEDARREIEKLMPRVPSIVVTVPGVAEPVVTIDGVAVPTAALGVKRSVDVGAHVVRVVARGYEPAERSVTLQEGKVETVVLAPRAAANAPEAAPVAVAPAPDPPPVGPEPAPPLAPPAAMSTHRVISIVAIGAGGAGLLVGAVAGGLAVGKYGSLTATCPDGHCKASQKTAVSSDVDSYHTLTSVSTGGFIAGGAALGAGVVLFLTAPKTPSGQLARVSPIVGPGYFGAKGSF